MPSVEECTLLLVWRSPRRGFAPLLRDIQDRFLRSRKKVAWSLRSVIFFAVILHGQYAMVFLSRSVYRLKPVGSCEWRNRVGYWEKGTQSVSERGGRLGPFSSRSPLPPSLVRHQYRGGFAHTRGQTNKVPTNV